MQEAGGPGRARTRREFIRRAGVLAAGVAAAPLARAAGRRRSVTMKPRPDLLDAGSPPGAEVFQLTTESAVAGSHLYMEAQVFTPDSKRLVLHSSATAHGSDPHDPAHRYLRCDLDDGGSLHPLTEEVGATAASVSPDGRYLYYFVDETEVGGGRLSLKRVDLDGTDRRTLAVVDRPLPGTSFRPSQIYPLSTISSDGQHIAISAFLGDGKTEGAPWGLMVFDIQDASVRLIIHGPTWCNMHPQYSRSRDHAQCRDILIQENHGNAVDVRGVITRLVGGAGADIHVIRDDGTDFRDMPWGRDGNEACQGHQCWRGRSAWAITSTGTTRPSEDQLIEGRAAAHAGHIGAATPGAARNDLSRGFPNPRFFHFATDIAGKRLISDTGPMDRTGRIYVGELGGPGKDPIRDWRYVLCPRSSWQNDAHIHPFLSPDGTMGFLNSDESGVLQAYMVRGLP